MGKRIGEILLDLGYICEEDLHRALGVQEKEGSKRRLGEIIEETAIKEEELLEALALQFNIPVVDREDFPTELPFERLSHEFLRENVILPLKVTDSTLLVAMGDPTKTDAIDALEATFGYEIKPVLVKRTSIIGHLEILFASREAVMKRVIEDVEEDVQVLEVSEEVDHLKGLAQEKGIIQLVNLIIDNAVKDRASDIHIEPGEDSLRVRYRIDGILYKKELLPLGMRPAIASRIKLLASMNIAERRLPQDGRIKGNFGAKEVDIRVSTIPTVHGESLVMRILDRDSSFIGLEQLGFDSHLLQRYNELIHTPFGMILITGPTGSGKSTTLYASLDRINSPDKKIITIEEPVEYIMREINQINVKPKIGLTFANGLRHIVRQDPDVIMVGEIRDLETAGIAIHSALTGHLIFSTLHTNNASATITRLIDMGVENYLVSSTLIGVMAQRLVRRICPECKTQYHVIEDMVREFQLQADTLWKGQGCEHCSGTGYRGRIAIFELLEVNDDIRELIMEKTTVRELRDKAIGLGMRTLRDNGIEKVREGITTIDEVLRVTQLEL
ncbi:MAG TPA: type II secretion system protein GspE [Nitrospirae bacterium]|nr:type II secretion system protein GspE [Nitrospirota bacterium]